MVEQGASLETLAQFFDLVKSWRQHAIAPTSWHNRDIAIGNDSHSKDSLAQCKGAY
ncbi:hypothetical protein [Phormidium tenue]|uniref:hypothetical protein n=1 Tax=Phormidium tenue TaxID=126344 RepID=UPI0015C55F5E|nr:hypothetical protein [Phormidium tenue]MBD2230103.1 hypothetical protein [Phormidium tenue FACHB-1052]